MTKNEMVQFALKSECSVEDTMWHIHQQGRADAFREVDEKMADISAEKCEEYGVDCIEANADAFGDLGDWLEEKLKEGAE